MQIVDSYSESNYNGSGSFIFGNVYSWQGQTFTGDGGVLNSAKLYLIRRGLPTGNIVIQIYAHTGTWGTSGLPTGSVLATSDNVDISGFSTSYGLRTFTFSGANKITLENGVHYVLLGYWTGGNIDNRVDIGWGDGTSHGGNRVSYEGVFSAKSGDAPFYVYKDDVVLPSTITGISSMTGVQSITF